MFFPTSFALYDYILGIGNYFFFYAAAFAVLSVIFIIYAFTRKVAVFSFILLAISFTGLLLSLFIPHFMPGFIFLFFSIPLLAFQLFGSICGVLFSVITMSAVVVSYFLYSSGMVSFWNSDFTNLQYFMVLLTSIIMTFLLYNGSRKHENDMEQLIKGIFFDETTDLPLHKALDFSLSRDKEYLFFIAQITNYSDLCTIFGYEFSDSILVFFSKMLRENLSDSLDYNIFRLRGSDFGILAEIPDGTDKENALFLLGNINHSFSHMSMPWNNTDIFLTVFMGGVIVTDRNRKEFLLRHFKKNLKKRGFEEASSGQYL